MFWPIGLRSSSKQIHLEFVNKKELCTIYLDGETYSQCKYWGQTSAVFSKVFFVKNRLILWLSDELGKVRDCMREI